MPNSLLTGVSGLISHQRLLDVVGHNIANVNTHGFKTQRILFADSLYESISPASGGNEGGSGGTNPAQVGGGVKVSQTDRKFTQGPIENTGEALDFALNGDGFFTVTDGVSDSYTRAGAFSLDGDGFLVNPQGLYLKRFSNAGEPNGLDPGFQIPGDDRIQVPIGAPIQGVLTTEIDVTGNLSGAAEPPRAQQLKAATAFSVAGVPSVGADLLNSLDTTVAPFQAGDSIIIEGKTHDGIDVATSLAVDGTTTLQDLIGAIDGAFPGATASLQDGKFVLEAVNTGDSQLSITLRNDPANQGQLSFPTHKAEIITGKGPDTEVTIVKFYDVAGGEHELKLSFEKEGDDEWAMRAILNADEGVVLSGDVAPIIFNDDGNFSSTGDPSITIQVNGIANAQTIAIDFGDPGAARRLTHYDSKSSLVPDSDGSPPGVLTNINVEQDGRVMGIGSNGKIFTIAQLSIAKFRNNKGLFAKAENLFSESTNSGQAEIGSAGAGGRGIIRGSQLESSNVDIALEFTKLIVAQRGFSANARTITVSDEILEELTNIIR